MVCLALSTEQSAHVSPPQQTGSRLEFGLRLGPSQLADIENLDVEFQPLICQLVELHSRGTHSEVPHELVTKIRLAPGWKTDL